MAITRVAGLETDGTLWTATFGRHIIRIIKADYGDSIEPADLNEIGAQEVSAQTPGMYKPENLKITFRGLVFRGIVTPLLAKRGFGNTLIPITIGFEHPDLGSDSDLATGCRLVKITKAIDNSNKPNEITTEWKVRQYWHGGERKTINAFGSAVATGASKF